MNDIIFGLKFDVTFSIFMMKALERYQRMSVAYGGSISFGNECLPEDFIYDYSYKCWRLDTD
jgi:hypothetical protein